MLHPLHVWLRRERHWTGQSSHPERSQQERGRNSVPRWQPISHGRIAITIEATNTVNRCSLTIPMGCLLGAVCGSGLLRLTLYCANYGSPLAVAAIEMSRHGTALARCNSFCGR